MKTTLLSLTFAALALTAAAIPAHAATVDFQGSTLGFSRWSDFDAARGSGTSCSPFTISSYSWAFDNPTTTKTGNPVTFQWGSNAGGTVTLTVTCSNGSTVSKLRPVCFAFGVGGCVFPDAGYN